MLDLPTALHHRLSDWLRRDDGQGLVEYGLILVLVAVVTVLALELIGGGVTTVLTSAAHAA